ncbi:MAG TPA: MmcQ/YjbR family DNA-binding protein, partial [Thermoanaerobaculia bacterium]
RASPAVEGTSYGTPAFHIGKKFWLRLKEDGETIAIRISFDEREILMRAKPKAFYITDHYRDYPAVLVRLRAISESEMKDLLQRSWDFTAASRKRRQGISKSASCGSFWIFTLSKKSEPN